MEGRVEVCRGGVWGAVYDYSGWNFNDAQVTCRQLGYPSECELQSKYLPAALHLIGSQIARQILPNLYF